MKRSNGSTILTAAVIVALLATGACVSAQTTSFKPTTIRPKISKNKAIKVARQYTGIASDKKATVRYGLATDNVSMFPIIKRPAWEVTFADVKKTPKITTIMALVDAETGVMLKVSSPEPAGGGLNLAGRSPLKLKRVPSKPPRIQVMQGVTLNPDSTQFAAYFGMMAGDTGGNSAHERPCWYVIEGGTVYGAGSMPPGATGPPPLATQQEYDMDAETGRVNGMSQTNAWSGRIP